MFRVVKRPEILELQRRMRSLDVIVKQELPVPALSRKVRTPSLSHPVGVWRAVGAAPESLARNIHKVQTSKVGTGGELARDG